LPLLDDDLPEEYQEESEAAIGEPTDGNDEEEEIQGSGDGGEVDTILPGKTCGQRRLALEEASRAAGADDDKAEVDAGRPPRRAQSPSQEKVK
jgi:hypothetical protein